MDLIWKQVSNYEGKYEVSNTGIVRSVDRKTNYRLKGFYRVCKGKILKQWLNSWGYFFVVLADSGNNKTKMVHRLVLESFVGHPYSRKHQANHINGIKTDNRPENLEWLTPLQNTNHAINDLKKYRHGKYHWKTKLTEKDVYDIRRMYATGKYTQVQLSKRFNLHRGQISKICNYRAWSKRSYP